MRGRHAVMPAGIPRLGSTGLSRMVCNVPHSRTMHPWSALAAPTRNRTVWRCREARVPNLGEKREETCAVSGELREDACLQRRPRPLLFSASGPRRGTQGLHRPLPRNSGGAVGAGRFAPAVQACYAAFPEAELTRLAAIAVAHARRIPREIGDGEEAVGRSDRARTAQL